jgi:DNA-damage-inducible protein D
MTATELTKISLFHGKQIRKILWNDEWHFSVVDICSVLIESSDPGAYWRKLKQRLIAEGSEIVTFCHGLELFFARATRKQRYATDCDAAGSF